MSIFTEEPTVISVLIDTPSAFESGIVYITVGGTLSLEHAASKKQIRAKVGGACLSTE